MKTKKETEEKIIEDILDKLTPVEFVDDYYPVLRGLVEDGFKAGKQESEKENYIDKMNKLERLEKYYLQQLSAYKQRITEIIEELPKLKWTMTCMEFNKYGEYISKRELLSKINNQSQQKNAPKNLEAMRETKYSRSELTESDNSVNGSERQTADTEPEKLEDGTNKPSPRVEIPRSGSLNSKDLDFNSYVEGLVDGARAQKDGVLYIEKETSVCECGHPKSYHIIDKNWCQGNEDNCRCKRFCSKKTNKEVKE